MAQKRRPALTAKAIEGLRSVRWEAHAMVDEREGCNETWSKENGKDARTWRGIDYLDALIAWWDEQHDEQDEANMRDELRQQENETKP